MRRGAAVCAECLWLSVAWVGWFGWVGGWEEETVVAWLHGCMVALFVSTDVSAMVSLEESRSSSRPHNDPTWPCTCLHTASFSCIESSASDMPHTRQRACTLAEQDKAP